MFSGMFRDASIETAIEQAAAIGYDAVEVMVGFGADHLSVDCPLGRAAEIARTAEDRGISVCLIYTTLGGSILNGDEACREQLGLVERFCEIAAAMRCPLLKVTAGRLRDHNYRDEEAAVVSAWLGRASDLAAKRSVQVVAEIHFGQYCETVAMARRIADLVDRPNFGVIHDAGNLHITNDIYGQDSVDVLGDSILHVHIKDMVSAALDDEKGHDYLRGRFKRALLGDGDVDHLPLFRALRQIAYTGFLSCEASGGSAPVAVARHELAEVRRLLERCSQ